MCKLVKIYSSDIYCSHLFGFNKVALDGSSNAGPPIEAKSDKEPPTKPSIGSSSSILATQESVSEFITQVASLVK